MSIQAITWAWKQRTGDAGAKSVLVILCNYANEQGLAFPAVKTIAADTEMGERTVQRHLKLLQERGWIERKARYLRAGGRTSDTYRICLEREPEPPDESARQLRRARGRFDKKRAKVALRIFARDGYKCVRCGSSEDLTIDHITPLSAGGTDEDTNYQTLCGKCNTVKGQKEDRAAARAAKGAKKSVLENGAASPGGYANDDGGNPAGSAPAYPLDTEPETGTVTQPPAGGAADAAGAVEPDRPVCWTSQAGDIWQEVMGGEMSYGRIAAALKPLVEKHSAAEVLEWWRKYLVHTKGEGRAAYATPENFASRYATWKAGGLTNGKGNHRTTAEQQYEPALESAGEFRWKR